MIGRKWERFSDDDPTMNVYRMINGLVVLSRYERRVEGKVTAARDLPGGTFITLDNGREYPLDGPDMWDVEDYSKGEPEVGDTVKVQLKMTVIAGPVRRIDYLPEGIQLHIPNYPAPLFVGDRHDSWTVLSITK